MRGKPGQGVMGWVELVAHARLPGLEQGVARADLLAGLGPPDAHHHGEKRHRRFEQCRWGDLVVVLERGQIIFAQINYGYARRHGRDVVLPAAPWAEPLRSLPDSTDAVLAGLRAADVAFESGHDEESIERVPTGPTDHVEIRAAHGNLVLTFFDGRLNEALFS
jgi:hypothetical protein